MGCAQAPALVANSKPPNQIDGLFKWGLLGRAFAMAQ
jgi:hypothetical protein